ncbi:hypothetical protein PGT21_010341 [Puccinia graminis f. sp. tritici]|uniref:Uncharacterized protein n=1 Tax=Puccinia graminis f. sp. tritici TaxID=56615 RepID=A0A5B0LZV4_PUCGR|nr:hypothetical protein PGT21_010341 [Puccinia graminis f. sp. tritici]
MRRLSPTKPPPTPPPTNPTTVMEIKVQKDAMNMEDYMLTTTESAFNRLFGNRHALLFFLKSISPEVKLHEVTTIKRVSSKPPTPVNTFFYISHKSKNAECDPVESVAAIKGPQLIWLDIFCVTDDNTIVNVEMQMVPKTYFLNQMAYYSSRLITEKQAWSGNEFLPNQKQRKRTQVPWNYQLPPVYVILRWSKDIHYPLADTRQRMRIWVRMSCFP